ncbi:MAG: MlaD family protein [Bdellovibrionales bacterium]|jgi:phospholipid/cholesterol/gamma-HCH transport system substrate-binding protein|nr:MlaD family protein [Bdellovibrionales bacterium]
MKIKFNRIERIAGFFVVSAMLGVVVVATAIAIQKGFFEPKIELVTSLATADGVREGTIVSMQGLRIGHVSDIELVSNTEVLVKFKMSRKYADKVKIDSKVRVMRPFIIGEKVLDVSIGSTDAAPVGQMAKLESEATADIIDLLSGRALGPYFDLIGRMTENLKFVAEAFLDPKRSQALVRMFDDLSPLIRNASVVTKEAGVILKSANKDQQLVKVIGNLVSITNEVNRALPIVSKQSPEMFEDLSKIARNMAVLTDEMQKALPVIRELAPELPRASERAIEALDETVVTLKALQKSFLLRSATAVVRQEEKTQMQEREKEERERAEKEMREIERVPADAGAGHDVFKGRK